MVKRRKNEGTERQIKQLNKKYILLVIVVLIGVNIAVYAGFFVLTEKMQNLFIMRFLIKEKKICKTT